MLFSGILSYFCINYIWCHAADIGKYLVL